MIMGWMMDQYSIIRRQLSPAVITGKPVALGGSLGRATATGTGAFYVLEAIVAQLGLVAPKTVAVQGFGNAGSIVARHLFDAGYTVVAVSDSRGGIYTSNGLDIPSIQKFKADTRSVKAVYCDGSVCSLVDHEVITNEELLSLDVDILIPAALENQITAANADTVQARYIEEVNQRLKQQMVTAANAIWQIAQTHSVSIRTAAYIQALDSLGAAMDARGTRADYVGKK